MRLFPYAMIIAIIIAVLLVMGRDNYVAGIFLRVLRWPFIILSATLILISLKRKIQAIVTVCSAISLLVIGIEYGVDILSKRILATGTFDQPLSVMTYNLYFKNRSIQSSLKQIRKVQPDILLVQELTPELRNAIDKAFLKKFPYQFIVDSRGTHGMGIYSVFPIIERELLRDEDRTPFAQRTTVAVGGDTIQLFNVHLASSATAFEHPSDFLSAYYASNKVRGIQMAKLDKIAGEVPQRYQAQLLVGDLNVTRYEPQYRYLTRGWVDLFSLEGKGLGLNFPNNTSLPCLVTLDYIFGRGYVAVVSAEVQEGGGSDHLALSATIKL